MYKVDIDPGAIIEIKCDRYHWSLDDEPIFVVSPLCAILGFRDDMRETLIISLAEGQLYWLGVHDIFGE